MIDHKTVNAEGEHIDSNAANRTFHRFLGADLGNELMLSEKNADKIGADIGHPCADEDQQIGKQTVWHITHQYNGGNAKNHIKIRSKGGNQTVDILLTLVHHRQRHHLKHQQEENAEQLIQYLQFHYVKRHGDRKIVEAYNRLAKLLEGKNYFVVSLCTDDLIFDSALDAAKIVTPCGGFRAMQCMKECVTDQEALVSDENVMNALLESIDNCGGDLNAVDFPVCAECTKPLWFNQISAPDYKEEGYLEQWQLYTKWLQGTMNRNLCILELGVGMQFPQVIRFPFEKVGYFNNKAKFFRVHSRLYQLTEELKDKGTAIAQNPVDFLNG